MIHAKDLSFAIGGFRLGVAELEVSRGEYFVLLGPPGSGKSILLECLCGLKRSASGRISIDGRDVGRLEPRERGIGYVPQDYALFRHLSVERNIQFGLRAFGATRETIRRRTGEVADMLGITHLLARRIPGLSGGEQQRVALARALAIEPKVLLLDEPVSALDEATRESVCCELRRVQTELAIATIHVSHNLEEAFSVADRGGILRDGTFQQIGTLSALLRKPRNEFVARFMRCENLLYAQAVAPGPDPGTTRVQVDQVDLVIPGHHEGKVKVVIRPENLQLATRGTESSKAGNALPVHLVRAVGRGAYVRAELSGTLHLFAHLPRASAADLHLVDGGQFVAIIRPEDMHVLDEDDTKEEGSDPSRTGG